MKILYNYFITICLICNISIYSKANNIKIHHTSTAPVIDGVIDILWNQVPAVSIDSALIDEQPTVTAFWKALWNDDAFYVLIYVEDDDHWPSWKSGGNWYEYDQPEVYFDINDILDDGAGPGGKGNGHYQTLSAFVEGGSGVQTDLPTSNYRPGGYYCYNVTGENYIIEFALDYTSFVNIDFVNMSSSAFQSLDSIGFDVCIIDQDEGITTARQRAVWNNTGRINENYVNMDDAGTITLVNTPPVNISSPVVSEINVYPDPANNLLTIDAEFNRLIFYNVYGTMVKTIESSDKNVEINMLNPGIYIIQVFNGRNNIGVTKFIKN